MEIRRLNTFRGLAAIIVIISHYSNESGIFGTLLGEGGGSIGVMLFFLLSGFLMSNIYYHKVPNSENLKLFIVARFARVFPLFFAVVLGSFVLRRYDCLSSIGVFVYEIDSVKDLASHLLLLHGTGILWTVSTEIQFYFLFMIAWVARPYLEIKLYMALGFLLLVDFMWGFKYGTNQYLGFTVTPAIVKALPYFISGAILGHLYKIWKPVEKLTNNSFVLILAVIPLLYPAIFHFITGRNHGMWEDVGVLFVLSSVFFVYVFLIPPQNPIIENKIGDFYGKISYSLYLLHIPILMLFSNLGLFNYGLIGFGLFIAVVSVVSYVSFTFFENPIRVFLRNKMVV